MRALPLLLLLAACGAGPEKLVTEGDYYVARWKESEDDTDFRLAVRAYQQAASMEPNNSLYRYKLGFTLAAGRCYEYALPELQAALALNPSDRLARNDLEFVQEAISKGQEQCDDTVTYTPSVGP